ncbi:MAG: DUF2193 domain-containing protein [Synergistaceae bacterium]|nr:DUF2193 domain-containing protein [Synergistaceae bacterium]
MSLQEKMIKECIGAAEADFGVIKEKRGGTFKITDAKPYVDAVNAMKPTDGQSKEIFDLHVQSVNAHYEVLKEITDTIRPEDDPFIEHHQTPPILEILFELDPSFKESTKKFIDAIGANKALIGLEAVRRYGGMYGPTCVVDFGFSVGSVPNLVNRILKPLDIPQKDKETLLASKSWGMNTSYGLGGAFRAAIESGKTAGEGEAAEVAQLQRLYDQPVAAQKELMATHNLGGHGPHSSFDLGKYMDGYSKKMKPVIEAAFKAGVHPANIVTVPAYCVGDIGHHIAQSAYNMFKDDMVFAIYEAVTQVFSATLKKGLEMDAFKSGWDVVAAATGAPAAAAACVLALDAFNVPILVDLLVKRFHNYAAINPKRGEADELHNVDFMDILKRGEAIIDGGGKIKGIEIDFSPVTKHPVISNPQRYTYPACAITQRFAALMSLSDFPCYLTPECVTATAMTNMMALKPGTPGAPMRGCKDCAVSTLIKRCAPYAKGALGSFEGYCQCKETI